MQRITTILFDLDGTLLPMDQDTFIGAYFKLLVRKVAPLGFDQKKLYEAIWGGTAAMIKNDGSKRNEEAFWRFFAGVFGEESLRHQGEFDAFYKNEFQQVQSFCGYTLEAKKLIDWLKARGYRLALATNPLFPQEATYSRIRWAGLQPSVFEQCTTYENASFCKPELGYYEEVLSVLGVKAEECLMIGNDVSDDMVAGKLGMKVFLLTDCLINKDAEDINLYPHGSFDALYAFLETLNS